MQKELRLTTKLMFIMILTASLQQKTFAQKDATSVETANEFTTEEIKPGFKATIRSLTPIQCDFLFLFQILNKRK
jgi:hypothetical protein